MTNIAFFGTDEFAGAALEAVVNTMDFKIITVVTQPDRPIGRNQKTEKPPVKIVAEKYGLLVIQPESLKNLSDTIGVENFQPLQFTDLNIVYRYGLIIPQSILALPKYGTINIHPSLLPKYRGPSPIQTAIINGDTKTGITIMLMDEKMDHGPILAQEKFVIEPDDTYTTLSERMTPRVNELLLQTITRFLSGEIKPETQNDGAATFSKILSRDDGKIDWEKTADEIYNLYRGFTPWPGVWTTWEGKRLKLLKIQKNKQSLPAGEVKIDNDRMFVGTSKEAVEILEIQIEGKKAMETKMFLQGYKNITGAKL